LKQIKDDRFEMWRLGNHVGQNFWDSQRCPISLTIADINSMLANSVIQRTRGRLAYRGLRGGYIEHLGEHIYVAYDADGERIKN